MSPEIGARVLALDPDDRVLLLLSIDPDAPERRWLDLPGGKSFPGESQTETAKRELREEAGIVVDEVGEHLWDREVWFYLRGRWHYRSDRVFLARVPNPHPTVEPAHTVTELSNLIEARWMSVDDMITSGERFLPAKLPHLVDSLLKGTLETPLHLTE